MYGVKFLRNQVVKNSAGEILGTDNFWQGSGEGRVLKINEVTDPMGRVYGSAVIDCGFSGDKLIQTNSPETINLIKSLEPGDAVRFVGRSMPNRRTEGFHVVLNKLEVVPEVVSGPVLVPATPVENSTAA